ncbi:MAG: histidine phosphatase family protein [Pseudomonadota bacterium]
MSVWHWVRHGPTHQKTFVGWRDVPADLSDTDLVARVSAALPQDALVVSSDLLRAVQTGDAIAGDRARLPHVTGLRELNFGAWDGKHFTQIPEAEGRAYWERPGHTAPPGGESWNDAAARVAAAVRHLRAAYPGRTFIAVAHIGVILTQVQAARGWRPVDALAHKIDNLSITTIDWDHAGDRVRRINHLP